MQVESLKVYCDLVDTASFSLAAERNGITQSAVSQQIRALETKYAVTFFMRGRKNFAVTPEGQAFARVARRIVDQYRMIGDELNSVSGAVSGRLNIAVIPSIGLYTMRAVFERYQTENPDVELKLSYQDSETVSDSVSADTADLGIVDYHSRDRDLMAVEFASEKLVLVTSNDHPFASKSRVKIEKLEGLDAVLPPSGSLPRKAIDRALRQAGVKLGEIDGIREIETIKRMVEVTTALSILPESTVTRDCKLGILSSCHITGATLSRPLSLLQKRTRTVVPAARTFLKLLTGKVVTG